MVLFRRSNDSWSAAGGDGADEVVGWGCAPKALADGPRGWRMGATGSDDMGSE